MTYLQDLDDRRLALGISSDIDLSHVLGYLTGTNHENYLPAFIRDTSFERVEWVSHSVDGACCVTSHCHRVCVQANSILAKLWPRIASYSEKKVASLFEEMLEKYNPSLPIT